MLGISKSADATEIKKAYRKAAIKNHPDKGGDEAKFKECTHAYEVLSDPEKRELYDNYGEEALKDGGGVSAEAEGRRLIFLSRCLAGIRLAAAVAGEEAVGRE